MQKLTARHFGANPPQENHSYITAPRGTKRSTRKCHAFRMRLTTITGRRCALRSFASQT